MGEHWRTQALALRAKVDAQEHALAELRAENERLRRTVAAWDDVCSYGACSLAVDAMVRFG